MTTSYGVRTRGKKIQDFDKILVIGQIENGTMPTGWRVKKPNGWNADLGSSGPSSEVGKIGMVTKRKNIMMMLNTQEKEEMIPDKTRSTHYVWRLGEHVQRTRA